MKLVQFGAGRIGRSFIGQVFSRSGWQVVFIDQDSRLVSLLNEKKEYKVVIKREGKTDEVRLVGPVSAIDLKNTDVLTNEIADADILAVSVGQRSFSVILPLIAEGIQKRLIKANKPLDIIIAENARTAVQQFKNTLSMLLGACYSDDMVGLIETSIGKMVPIMKQADLMRDPLQLFAEEYETLIVDKRGFRGSIPNIPEIFPVDPIAAFVDRKLFIHNLSHASIAYLGFKADPKTDLIDRALLLPDVEEGARGAVIEAADALAMEYLGSYNRRDLACHIEDLFERYRNSALNGSLYWAGRDIPRKLSRNDRITAPMLLCVKHGLCFEKIAEVYGAGIAFAKPDESGRLFPLDEQFRAKYLPAGIDRIPAEISGLDASVGTDKKVLEVLTKYMGYI
jgi:mannitol-1-phosphate 5-dehydrogenase